MGKEGILGEAEYHIRRPMPSITAGDRPTPRHGGWWRPIRAASHRPHARSLRPNATRAIGPNPVPTLLVNQLHCVVSRPPFLLLPRPASSNRPQMLGVPSQGQFEVRNRMPVSACLLLSWLLSYFSVSFLDTLYILACSWESLSFLQRGRWPI